ncbi:hypothetical protein [Kingella potus]|uniref:hypothetical protein n=1 Tax=Kingella potus TaxID=265175 RepID=UPI001FD61AC4|nr:hypothetical protein [Kingella potus]UOP00705.1 hypothetical protein LVJ84_13060 [Kingella potus]
MPPEGGARVRMRCRKSENLTTAENACVAVRHTLQNGERPSEKRFSDGLCAFADYRRGFTKYRI